MKKFSIVFTFAFFCSFAVFAQCDKPVLLTASKTEYLDASMAVQRTVEEKSTVVLSDSTITISAGSDNAMNGTVTAKTCNWTVPYKTGKSVVQTTLTDENGTSRHMTLTIEGKDGKLTLLAEIAEMPDQKIRVPIDTFGEKK